MNKLSVKIDVIFAKYTAAVAAAKTEEERAKALTEANAALQAAGSKLTLEQLTEEQRLRKKEQEDAEECCGTRDEDLSMLDGCGIDKTVRPDLAGKTIEVTNGMGCFKVTYNEKGCVSGYCKTAN